MVLNGLFKVRSDCYRDQMRTELALPLKPDEACQFIPDAYKAKKKIPTNDEDLQSVSVYPLENTCSHFAFKTRAQSSDTDKVRAARLKARAVRTVCLEVSANDNNRQNTEWGGRTGGKKKEHNITFCDATTAPTARLAKNA